jgi:hypothetical protein
MKIILTPGQRLSAAQKCDNYNGGNYSDWYLPSKYELNLLYLQKSVVGKFLDYNYWSSTEVNKSQAWNRNFTSGGSERVSTKDIAFSVRPIRAFQLF